MYIDIHDIVHVCITRTSNTTEVRIGAELGIEQDGSE